jgi:hypothetical protein
VARCSSPAGPQHTPLAPHLSADLARPLPASCASPPLQDTNGGSPAAANGSNGGDGAAAAGSNDQQQQQQPQLHSPPAATAAAAAAVPATPAVGSKRSAGELLCDRLVAQMQDKWPPEKLQLLKDWFNRPDKRPRTTAQDGVRTASQAGLPPACPSTPDTPRERAPRHTSCTAVCGHT